MKFMDAVETNVGWGTVVARTGDGGLLASIDKEKVIGRSCRGPCLNVMVKWCEEKGIWCEEIASESIRLEIASQKPLAMTEVKET